MLDSLFASQASSEPNSASLADLRLDTNESIRVEKAHAEE